MELEIEMEMKMEIEIELEIEIGIENFCGAITSFLQCFLNIVPMGTSLIQEGG